MNLPSRLQDYVCIAYVYDERQSAMLLTELRNAAHTTSHSSNHIYRLSSVGCRQDCSVNAHHAGCHALKSQGACPHASYLPQCSQETLKAQSSPKIGAPQLCRVGSGGASTQSLQQMTHLAW